MCFGFYTALEETTDEEVSVKETTTVKETLEIPIEEKGMIVNVFPATSFGWNKEVNRSSLNVLIPPFF